MNARTATPRPMTAECNTCPACQTRREVARPSYDEGSIGEWIVWSESQEAAVELDCHCNHATCASLDPEHDPDECDYCLHRNDPDEDVARER